VTKQGDWGVAAVAAFLIGACVAIWFVSRHQVVDHTNVNDVDGDAEPAGVVTAAIAAVSPPPAGTPAQDLKTTIPAQPQAADSEPTTQPATV
jgi:inorganic phosphate transporter, PiT family